MTVEKPKPKLLLQPITTGANSAMNHSEFLGITCNLLKAIGFGFVSNWLENWRETVKAITKRSNRNHVITFDSHLKTALYELVKMERVIYQNVELSSRSEGFLLSKVRDRVCFKKEKSPIPRRFALEFQYGRHFVVLGRHGVILMHSTHRRPKVSTGRYKLTLDALFENTTAK